MATIAFIKKYYPFILFTLVIGLSVFSFQTWNSLRLERANNKYQQDQNEKNINALSDSITLEFNRKLKAWEYSKDNYVVQKLEDLKKYNQSLAKELEKVKGDVIAAIKTQAEVDLGGIETSNDIVVIDEKKHHYGLNFESYYKDAGFEQKLVGTSKFYAIPDEKNNKWNIQPDITVLDTNLTSINITYGFKELKDKYQVFAITPSDKINFTDLTGGYFIDKQPPPPPTRKKKFGVGPYVGYGISSNIAGEAGFGWSVGVAVHYDIFQF